MSAGRDVRGIKRGHQFDKVEMYKFTAPENSYDELETMVETGWIFAADLGFPHRLLQMCTGDLGFTGRQEVRYRAVGAGLPASGWR